MDQVRYAVALPTVQQIADILLLAPPDLPWSNEGRCRHAIRRILILVHRQRWKRADREAQRLVANARMHAGIRMPTGWESIYDPHSWVIISCCPICDRPFRQRRVDHWYCSPQCRCRADFIRDKEQLDTTRLHCEGCGDILVDPGPAQRFCTKQCRERNGWRRRNPNDDHVCVECAAPLPEASPTGREKRRTAKYCSASCINRAFRRKKANGHAQPPMGPMDMTMRMITDPQPTLDLTAPEIENACLRIALELEAVKREHPEMTPRQALQEASGRDPTEDT